MSPKNEQVISSLLQLLNDLANQIDGLVDLGITICFVNDEHSGADSAGYFVQTIEKVRTTLKGILVSLNEARQSASEESGTLQHELLSATERFLRGFESLATFRSLSVESLRSATTEFHEGWDTIHALIQR